MVSDRFFLCFIFSITLKSVRIFLMQAVSTLVRNSFYLLQCKPLWSAVNWQKNSRTSSMRQHWRVRGFRQIPGCSKGAVKNLQNHPCAISLTHMNKPVGLSDLSPGAMRVGCSFRNVPCAATANLETWKVTAFCLIVHDRYSSFGTSLCLVSYSEMSSSLRMLSFPETHSIALLIGRVPVPNIQWLLIAAVLPRRHQILSGL